MSILVEAVVMLFPNFEFIESNSLDAVILTHHHADHLHGIDDIRHFVYKRRSALPIFLLPETDAHIRANMRYIFEGSG